VLRELIDQLARARAALLFALESVAAMKKHRWPAKLGLPTASLLFAMHAATAHAQQASDVPGSASPTTAGDTCRKEICDSAEAGCMSANLSLNPLASTASEKKVDCAQFYSGCMKRYITPDVPWYSPEIAARFLKCPS
jgi:hypothetical protein